MPGLGQKIRINGLHHVTAIAAGPQRNLDFWSKTLGLRFIKKTVNFDDPGTYHLYYGDEVGSAGTVMTFFPWPGVTRGRAGAGEAGVTQIAVPRNTIPFWRARLEASDARVEGEETRFGENRLLAADPDGLRFALVEVETDPRAPWTTNEISADVAIRGFHGVSLSLSDSGATSSLLTDLMDYDAIGSEAGIHRFEARGDNPARFIEIKDAGTASAAHLGAGSVHHVAFAVADDPTQAAVRQTLVDEGWNVTPVIDRNYFHSIYFRTPGGVLFEIATHNPGFAVDEPVQSLGQALKLPRQHEDKRETLEAELPKLAL